MKSLENKKYFTQWMIALFAAGYPVLIIGLFKMSGWSDIVATVVAGAVPIFFAIIIAIAAKIK